MKILCRLGFHSWPRMHGQWREVVVSPASANCLRCQKQLSSVWRSAYPEDGSRCNPKDCSIHVAA
jgi:hypothetical protein